MVDQRADAGLKKKRETQRERIARAIYEVSPVGERGWADAPANTRATCFGFADAAIAAHPDPLIKKERGRPKLPTDDCVLCALRREFVALVEFIEANADHIKADGPLVLARALREQGVV